MFYGIAGFTTLLLVLIVICLPCTVFQSGPIPGRTEIIFIFHATYSKRSPCSEAASRQITDIWTTRPTGGGVSNYRPARVAWLVLSFPLIILRDPSEARVWERGLSEGIG
uniref:Uncharacterized protein n=1 Tax=Timema douglasi TaxID=61478 RepID=A0A7R8VQ74_TIMDO|nr:unnamed protein product [Timema douglasi]